MLGTGEIGESKGLTLWEERRSSALRDLIIKKVFLNTIFLLNAAGLGIAIYCIVSYCPIPSKALITAPIVGGVVAAIVFLRLPLCGITRRIRYKDISNPAHQLGKVLTILFFGPWLLLKNNIDEMPYHDPDLARVISRELREGTFEKVSEKYGDNFRNLFRYGYIQGIPPKDLIDLHDEFVPIARGFKHTEKTYILNNNEADEHHILSKKKKEIEDIWENIKNRFTEDLPFPLAPHHDHSSWKDRFELYCRDLIFSPNDYIDELPQTKKIRPSELFEH